MRIGRSGSVMQWRVGVSMLASLAMLSAAGCQSPEGGSARSTPAVRAVVQAEDGEVTYEPDCNDPAASNPACIHPTEEIVEEVVAAGYPHYIGHAEPTAEFFSRAGQSGANMQWKFQLPGSDPAPTQNGSSVANFELYAALWLGLALC